MTIDQLREMLNSKGLADRNPDIMRRLDYPMIGESPENTVDQPASDKAFEMEEDLAARAVALFRDYGLRARTDGDITSDGPVAGWYVHFPNAKKNPIVLDYLVLIHKTGRYHEIELKSRTGKIRPLQKAILEHGGASYMCRTIGEVKQVLDGLTGRTKGQPE